MCLSHFPGSITRCSPDSSLDPEYAVLYFSWYESVLKNSRSVWKLLLLQQIIDRVNHWCLSPCVCDDIFVCCLFVNMWNWNEETRVSDFFIIVLYVMCLCSIMCVCCRCCCLPSLIWSKYKTICFVRTRISWRSYNKDAIFIQDSKTNDVELLGSCKLGETLQQSSPHIEFTVFTNMSRAVITISFGCATDDDIHQRRRMLRGEWRFMFFLQRQSLGDLTPVIFSMFIICQVCLSEAKRASPEMQWRARKRRALRAEIATSFYASSSRGYWLLCMPPLSDCAAPSGSLRTVRKWRRLFPGWK